MRFITDLPRPGNCKTCLTMSVNDSMFVPTRIWFQTNDLMQTFRVGLPFRYQGFAGTTFLEGATLCPTMVKLGQETPGSLSETCTIKPLAETVPLGSGTERLADTKLYGRSHV